MTTTDIEQADGEPGRDVELAESGGEVELSESGGAVVPAAGGGDDGDFTKPTALFEPGETPRSEAIRTRVILPILLPIVSAATIFFYVINVSRVLLAGRRVGLARDRVDPRAHDPRHGRVDLGPPRCPHVDPRGDDRDPVPVHRCRRPHDAGSERAEGGRHRRPDTSRRRAPRWRASRSSPSRGSTLVQRRRTSTPKPA